MPNFGVPDRDLLDRINRLEAQMSELSRAHGAPISAIRDVNGTGMVEADPVTGVALGRPYLPLPFSPAWWQHWPRTWFGPPTWNALWDATLVKQHPAVIMTIGGICSTGTTGHISITLNGEQVWPEIAFVAGSRQYVQVGPIAVPGDFLSPFEMSIIGLLDTVVDGNSTMYVQVFNAYGTELRDPLPL